MNQITDFIARVRANKVTAGLGIAIILSATIIFFPKCIAWLPPEIGKSLWNFANQTILYAIGLALMFVKGHASVGDPAKPDVATFNDQKDAKANPDDWQANAAGKADPQMRNS